MDIDKLFEETIPKFSEEYKDFVWSMMPIKFDDFYFIVATDILDYTLGVQKEETAHIKERKSKLEGIPIDIFYSKRKD